MPIGQDGATMREIADAEQRLVYPYYEHINQLRPIIRKIEGKYDKLSNHEKARIVAKPKRYIQENQLNYDEKIVEYATTLFDRKVKNIIDRYDEMFRIQIEDSNYLLKIIFDEPLNINEEKIRRWTPLRHRGALNAQDRGTLIIPYQAPIAEKKQLASYQVELKNRLNISSSYWLTLEELKDVDKYVDQLTHFEICCDEIQRLVQDVLSEAETFQVEQSTEETTFEVCETYEEMIEQLKMVSFESVFVEEYKNLTLRMIEDLKQSLMKIESLKEESDEEINQQLQYLASMSEGASMVINDGDSPYSIAQIWLRFMQMSCNVKENAIEALYELSEEIQQLNRELQK